MRSSETQDLSAADAEGLLVERYGYRTKPTKYVATFECINGNLLALERTRDRAFIFVKSFPEEETSIELRREYPPEKSRNSNLKSQAPTLAQGHAAQYVLVRDMDGLKRLCDHCDAAKETDEAANNSGPTTSVRTWTKYELNQIVATYLSLSRSKSGASNLDDCKKGLAQRLNSSTPEIETTFRELSFVLAIKGREWIYELSPPKSVDLKNGSDLEEALAQFEQRPNDRSAAYEIEMRQLTPLSERKPTGALRPESRNARVQLYNRDPAVKAWVLANSEGKCESCCSEAPFTAIGGYPFLEVHHIRRLTDGGSDTIQNAAALCPNCHRAFHYSDERRELADRLYKNVSRLVRE